jgi:carboxyl-terminal processing protease
VPTARLRRWPIFAVLLLLGAFLPARALAQNDFRQLALAAEARGDWRIACGCYEEILKQNRASDLREAYQRCLRRLHLARRHHDQVYQDVVSQLTTSQALDVYEDVLNLVSRAYIDRSRATVGRLVQSGIQELIYALDEEAFVQTYLPGSPPDSIKALKERLAELPEKPGMSRSEARNLVWSILPLARQAGLVTRPVLIPAIALELAAGACNALDEYTLFLTPHSLSDAQATSQGRGIGTGAELTVMGKEVIVSRVYPKSPAEEMGLMPQDRVLRINGQPAEGMTPEVLADKLRGEAGAAVELEVQSPGQMQMPHTVRLVRRVVVVPSVEYRMLTEMMDPDPVGLLRIISFTDSTPQEVKEALAQLRTAGIRALVLDLRGNPGGLFDSGIDVAKLFLGSGVIAYTQGTVTEYNRPFKADAGNPFELPMVAMVNSETASSAELLAGALKDLGRARLMGQPTYGKGTIQCIFPLKRSPANLPSGIRLSVAYFLSPNRLPYHGKGIIPHDVLDTAIDNDSALNYAKAYLQGALKEMMR